MNSQNNHLIHLEILAFITDRKARHLSSNTIKYYTDELNKFNQYLITLNISQINDITTESIRQYLIELSSNRNAGGIHAAYRAIKAFMRWYATEIDDPSIERIIRKIKPPKVNPKPLPGINISQIQQLIQTCDKSFNGSRDRAIFYTLLDTGLRRAEFTALNIQDINFNTGAVQIRHGKGDKARIVFVSPATRREILRYLRHHPDPQITSPLWVTSKGTRLTYAGLREIIRRRAKKAGIPEPQIHDFRRAYAIETLRNNGDLARLSYFLGHADIKTTQRYLHITDDDIAEFHNMTSPVIKSLI